MLALKLDGNGVLETAVRLISDRISRRPYCRVDVSNQNIFLEAMGAGAELCLLEAL